MTFIFRPPSIGIDEGMKGLFSQIIVGIIVTVVGTIVANAVVNGHGRGHHFFSGFHFSGHDRGGR